ncbi:MAG: T9SS type A sorting domain-containing protein [Bacteroidetes bacterium]|nr:T9SS type A sorting domain-containing protein [Bacteroidota bacterium]
MKRFLLSFLVLVSIAKVYAQTSQLLINENFSGYSAGNLNGQGGSYPWTASSLASSDFVQVASSSPLFYPGYTSGSQYINLTAKDDYSNLTWPFFHFPDDPAKNFIGNTNVPVNAATTFYTSFVVRVPSSAGVRNTSSASPELALQTTSGINLAYFYIADANSGNDLKFGISKDGGNGSYAGTNFSFNTTYLIVMRYDIVTSGSSNDRMYMWVNPVISTEPSTASANVSITSGNDGGFLGSVNSIQLFQDLNSATASLDAIRAAYGKGSTTAVNSAAAWAALNPVGAPLPVKFGDIKAYPENKGVQVDWEVYSETGVAEYKIERSTDGTSFMTIGSINAKGQDGKLYYSWFDAAPASGINYYRVRNLDIDGKSSFSSIVKVNTGELPAGITLYPNPVSGNHLSIQASGFKKGDYQIELYTIGGQQLYKKQFTHAGGTINQAIELPPLLKAGIYTIRLTGAGIGQVKQFLIH